jgi:hypothetical protein
MHARTHALPAAPFAAHRLSAPPPSNKNGNNSNNQLRSNDVHVTLRARQ